MLVQASFKKKAPLEPFNISFESTQNKQQYVLKLPRDKKSFGDYKNLLQFLVVLTYTPLKLMTGLLTIPVSMQTLRGFFYPRNDSYWPRPSLSLEDLIFFMTMKSNNI